ncbi:MULTISPECIES: DeoR/GlpR family DNA-binding transcription regulator [Capnocytophaga]|uniref:DeoR/GlpR transcriptional regulator n=1 Tax=Capnocytophaga canis TaxID=1848903 RepID=A0A0B7HX25_9FLAO|nr:MULTISPECIES: DeoR/GlpR family DNA-binding transcription regulator [Capnocytophaga]ATA73597.1 DeoR/GlpR transcriptional regulator [Capnocytophaga sp. H4358]ATA75738.1 DeoR/GlpR transcriptional regulator [Capnocytophaga sp. H2931]RIY36058.1 DeoR/GlpR transcriptional regulator [Capnocytophaga canis]CEN43945.1 Transcriptional regulator, DeoR family [Capnocytophaga canis]CEN49618.1 Transcriptional regulator, DeoR family [Capnocytophaga canis]
MKVLNERQIKIVEYLDAARHISVNDLSERLNVSVVTIRKDLTLLEQEGYLHRTHGGASKQMRYVFDQTISEKETLHVDEKIRITTKALEYIKEGDFIILSSGTTIHLLAQKLPDYKNLTVLTPSLRVALDVCKHQNINTIHLGGEVRKNSTSTVGAFAEETLSNFLCTTLFLSVEGLDLDFGISTTNAGEAHLNRKMVDHADKLIVLADSSKMHKRGFGFICYLEKIDILITDNKIDPEFVEELEKRGVEVVIA